LDLGENMKKYLLLTLVILFSCDENSTENTPSDNPLVGIWVNQDKDELFEFTKDKVIFAQELDLRKNRAKRIIKTDYEIIDPGQMHMLYRDTKKIVKFNFEVSGEKLKLQLLSTGAEEITNFVKYKQKISYY
jgi:hypothetical protein